ncbi:hypothetical protein [Streptomyces sp. KL118A]|uniref:nSTAND1 domain-containing NTPase n=1 Tax=Streptomyces sp. KL118A TaxID=3045153 RepID=UPI00278BBB13|nr:hypothetical protein [Streptomyces sp. KL118A]
MGRREKPVDPAAGPTARFAVELRKLRSEAGGIAYRALAERTGYSITALSQAAAGEKLPSLPLTLAYAKACGGDAQDWERRWHAAAREESETAAAAEDTAEAPYRGLARFEPGDAHLFFGRGQLTDDLTQLVQQHPVTVVFGPSGSGKSSLLRAGLIPRLRHFEDAALRPAAIRILTPGAHPLRTHAHVLTPVAAAGDTWLVVDQFEEAFTLCHDPTERAGFITRLLAARHPESRLRVLLGVRADFYTRCLEHPELAATVRKSSLPVGPMTASELREAIVKPATAAGLTVERTLTTHLVDQAATEPGSLPLLSHALLETWRHRRGNALTHEAYSTAGGLHGAITRTAEDVCTRLSETQADTARRILLRLITPGEGTPDTRRPIDVHELEEDRHPDTRTVLDLLARARLITLEDTTVDLAHEALITAWPRLSGWIEEDRDRLRAHRRLTEAATAWDELDRDGGALYRGTRLASAEEHFPHAHSPSDTHLTDLERTFLNTSTAARGQEEQAAARTTRRLRRFSVAVSVLLVLALTAGLLAWQQSRTSDQQRARAVAAQQTALSRQLAAQSAALLDTQPDLASLLAVHAYDTGATKEAATSLRAAAGLPLDRRLGRGPSTEGMQSAYSPDGRTLAVGSLRHGTAHVELRDAASGRTRRTFTGIVGDLPSLMFDRRGRLLVSGHDDSEVWRWDAATGARRTTLRGAANLWKVFSPDARTLAAVRSDDGSVRLWDPSTGRRRATLDGAVSRVRALTFTPDGRTMAIGGVNKKGQGVVQLWDVVSLKSRSPLLVPGDAVTSLAIGGDGRTLATAGADGKVRLWDLGTGRARATFFVQTTEGPLLRFSPDGRTLATSGNDLRIRLWETPTGKARTTLAGHSATLSDLTFSPDGNVLASSAVGGEVRLWDMTAEAARVPTITRSDELAAIAFSPDGRLLATGSNSGPHGGEVRLWNTVAGTPRTTALRAFPEVRSVAFSPDGRSLAVLSGSARSERAVVRLWDVRTGKVRATLTKPLDHVLAIAFTSHGDLLTAGDATGVVRSWNIASGETRMFKGFAAFSALTPVAAFSPDGRTVAAGDTKGRVRLWDVESGTLRTVISQRADKVGALAFSPDGHTLALNGRTDGEVRLYDTDTGRLRHAFPRRAASKAALAFSPDGKHIAGGSDGGTVRLWDAAPVRPDAALRKVCRSVNRGLTPEERATYLKDPVGPSPCRT